MLRDRRVNLSTLSLVYGVLNPKNASEVLDKVSCKSRREVESVVASYRGRSVKVKDRIRPPGGMKKKASSRSVTGSREQGSPVIDLFASEEVNIRGGCGAVPTEKEGALSEPDPGQSYELRFEVSEEVMKKYQEAELLLSKKYPRGVSLAWISHQPLAETSYLLESVKFFALSDFDVFQYDFIRIEQKT